MGASDRTGKPIVAKQDNHEHDSTTYPARHERWKIWVTKDGRGNTPRSCIIFIGRRSRKKPGRYFSYLKTSLNSLLNHSAAIQRPLLRNSSGAQILSTIDCRREPRVNPYVTAAPIVNKLSSDETPCSMPNFLLKARISSECGPSS